MALTNHLPLKSMLRMAWRNLWRNHRRTLIMLLAIGTGVWAMIFMTALIRGLVDQMVEDGIDALPGHVQVHQVEYRDDPSIENSLEALSEELLKVLQSQPVQHWAGRIRVPAMISSERDNRGTTLLGIHPAQEIALGFDPESIVAGRFLNGPDDDGVVIGRKMLERLETKLGHRVVLMSQDPDNEIADRGFRIIGVYKSKLPSQEEAFVYIGLNKAQTLLKMNGLSEIAVAGADFRDPGPVLDAVRSVIPDNARALAWQELDSYLSMMLSFMDVFVLIWIVVIFLALSFGLVNTLMMAVFERIREFGLMQALGMRPNAILYLVLTESVVLIILGLMVGNALAAATIYPIRGGLDISMFAEGMEMMGASSMLYPAVKVKDLVMANVVVIILGILTSLLPAWRAAQYEPVEAIAKT